MPSAKDVTEYRRGFAGVLDLRYNRQELTMSLTAAGTLYQKLAQSTEGYAGAVSIIHQADVVKTAIDALDAALQDAGGARNRPSGSGRSSLPRGSWFTGHCAGRNFATRSSVPTRQTTAAAAMGAHWTSLTPRDPRSQVS
jgi:hypothetical protein